MKRILGMAMVLGLVGALTVLGGCSKGKTSSVSVEPVGKTSPESVESAVDKFNVGWRINLENDLGRQRDWTQIFTVISNDKVIFTEVKIKMSFYKDDGKIVNKDKYLVKWDTKENITFTVPQHNYQKEVMKITALREDGRPYIAEGTWSITHIDREQFR
jgi:hypothetical protein